MTPPRAPRAVAAATAAPRVRAAAAPAALSSDWRTLEGFAEGQGFHVTSTTGGRHNSGSAHYAGRAVDVRTRDKTPEQIAALDESARAAGFVARDERTRPPGQSEWSGPHYHLEARSAPVGGAGDDLDKVLDAVPTAVPADDLDKLLDTVPPVRTAADDDVVSTQTSAPRYQASALPSDPHSLPRLSLPAQPNLETYAGRQQRDAINAQSSNPDARLVLDVHLPHGARDWSQVDDKGAVRAGVLQYAQTNDIPVGYTSKWLEQHADMLHFTQNGKPVQPVDLIYPDSPHYDAERRTLRVSTSLPIFKKLKDDFMASLPAADKFGEWLYGKSESGGEKMLDVAVPVVHGAAKVADVVSRPLAAVDANFWSKVNRPGLVNKLEALSNPLDTHALAAGYDALKGETPSDAHNPIAEAVRNNPTLKAAGFDSLGAGVTEALTSPSNLVLAGAGKAGVEALKGTRAGAQLAEAMGGGVRLTEFFNRGGRVLDIERAATTGTKAAGAVADGLLVTLKDEAGNLSHVNTATGEVSEVKTLPRIMGMTVPEALEKHPKLEEYVSRSLQNAQERAASFEAEAGRADLPDDYKKTHAVQAARAHDEAAYLRDVQAAIEAHRNPSPAPDANASGWQKFPAESDSLNVPRASMPQIKSEHRGAMVQFFKGRGITHQLEEVAPDTLRPSQAEFSPEKVDKARGFEGTPRRILVSADNYVVDGHHQWLASLVDAPDKPIPAIRLDAPAHQLLIEAARFPSSGVDEASITAAASSPVDAAASSPPLHEFLSDLSGNSSTAAAPPRTLRSVAATVGRTTSDVINLPKSLKSTLALHGPFRQGIPQVLAHPTFLKDALKTEVRAFASEEASQAFAREIILRPDFKVMQESGLFLPSTRDLEFGGHAPVSMREERFASRLADSTPGLRRIVRPSERAYHSAMDSIRVNAWDNYTRDLASNPNVTRETYKAVADLVNMTTGRGTFPLLDRSVTGRKIIAALNNPLWSPRAMASRFNILSPYKLVMNAANPATRPVAWLQLRDGMRAATTLGTTIGLLSLTPGVKVGVNPFASGWGKVSIGNQHYDLLDGIPPTAAYLAKMSHAFYLKANGKPVKPGQDSLSLTKDFLRRRLAPAPATAVDALTGKTAAGEPFTYTHAAVETFAPFIADDVYKAYLDSGMSGVLKAAPAGVLGIPVSSYKEKTPRLNYGGSRSSYTGSEQTPVPETPATLGAQFRSARDADSPRAAVLVTPGASLPKGARPNGFARLRLAAGTLYVHRRKASALGLTPGTRLREFVTQNGFESLIGKVAPVADTSRGAALRTEDADGAELSTSIVPTMEDAHAQAAEDRAQFPQATKQVLLPAHAAAAARRRRASHS